MKKSNLFAGLMGLAFMGTSFGLTSCADDRNDLTNTKANTAENQQTLTATPNQDIADYTLIMYATGGGNLDYSIMDELYYNYSGFGKKVKMAGVYKASHYVQQNVKGTDMEGIHYFECKRKENVDSVAVNQHWGKEHTAWAQLQNINDDKVYKATKENIGIDFYKNFCSDFVGEKCGDVNTDMGNPNIIAELIKTVAKKNPAKKYILVTDNHGMGWTVWGDGNRTLSRSQVCDDNLIDDINQDRSVSLDALNAGVQQSGVKFDAIFCDLCIMAYIENLTGFQQNFKFCIASAENTTFSHIGKLGTRLAAAGANISDDELFTQLTSWVKNDEYKNDWHDYAHFKYDNIECQSMGVYDLRKIDNLTSIMRDIATWYTTAYDNATYKRIINKAVMTSNCISTSNHTHLGLYTNGLDFHKAVGMSSDQIANIYANGESDKDLVAKVNRLPKELNNYAKGGMEYGITFSHFVYTTLELMKANNINNADVAKLTKLFNSYQSTLKNLSYIKCSYADFPEMDPYLWTSPTITLHSLNESCYNTNALVHVTAACKLSAAQSLAAYNNTRFDQQTGWSKLLRKLTVTPSRMTNPARTTPILYYYSSNK